MGTRQESEHSARLPRLRAIAPWLLLFAAALAVRSLRYGLVFVGDEVRFPQGADEFYHLRRIWFTVVNFPAALSFDPYVNHPWGATPVWTPLFDWSLAAVVRLLVGASDQHAVEVVAAWAPPLLGAASVLAAAWLVRRTFSPAAGWVTGALLAVSPGHVFHSALGVVDHHVAVGLWLSLLVAAAMRLAVEARPRAAVAAGAAIAAAIGLWPGFLLHVLPVQGFLVAQLFAGAEQRDAVTRARALALTHAVAALALLPFGAWAGGALSPQTLSGFQPLWFGAGALALALLAWLWSRPAVGRDRGRRLGAALAIAALGLAFAWVLVPGLAAGVLDAARWFEADPYLGVIAELEPLLFPLGRFEPMAAGVSFSYLFWAFPLALAGLGWHAVSRRRADVLLLLFVATALFALALYQQRFIDVATVGFAWVMGPALVAFVRSAGRSPVAPPAALASAALLAGALALLPQAANYRVELVASAATLRGDRVGYSPLVRRRILLERAARFLAEETPPTAGYLDPTLRPEYGVLSAWGQGHVLRYYSERPMVQDNFHRWGGDGFEAARRYFESDDEERAAEIAASLRARYVVATPMGSGQQPPGAGSLALRLVPRPLAGGGVGFRDEPERALARHRLVFLTDDTDLARAPGQSAFRVAVYEIVPGALVVGRAPGAEFVEFTLLVRVPGRPSLRYAARAPVDASGRYEIHLPYPTDEGYTVRSGSRRASLTLSLADVREGRTVAGPSFAE